MSLSNARLLPSQASPSAASQSASCGAAQPFSPGTLTFFEVPVADGTAVYSPTSPRELAALHRRFPEGKVRVQMRAEPPRPAQAPQAPAPQRRAAPAPQPSRISEATTSAGGSDVAQRIKSIVKSEHAVGREALAEHLAFNTDLSAAAAAALLAKAPKGATTMKQASSPRTASDHPTSRILANYRAATGRSPSPGAKASTPPSQHVAGDAKVARILANYRAATGAKKPARA